MTCKSYLSETIEKVWGRSAHIGPRKELASHQNMLPYLQCYPLTTVYSTLPYLQCYPLTTVYSTLPYLQCYPLTTVYSTGMTYLTVKVTLDVFISQHSLEHSEF